MLGIGARPKKREQPNSTNIRTETVTQNFTSLLKYEDPRERLASYEDHRLAVSKEKASEAGLYHTGKEDILQCFHCGLKLGNWQAHDDPMRKHASHNKDCQFVIQKKGEHYMEQYNLVKIERDKLLVENKRLCQQYNQVEVENGRLREQLGQAKERLSSLEKKALPKAEEPHDQTDHQENEAAEGGIKEDVKDKNLSAAVESCIQNGYSEEDVMKATEKLKEDGTAKVAQWPKHSTYHAKIKPYSMLHTVSSILTERFAA